MTLLASADHYEQQRRLTGEALAMSTRIWGHRPPDDFDGWFDAHVDDLLAVLMDGQRRAVYGADAYVGAALAEAGTPVDPDVEIAPSRLVGVASDGRPLESLLYGAVITAKGAVANSPEAGPGAALQAWSGAGLDALMLRVHTQLADASRVATGLAIAARPRVGYVRMLVPPSCSRCAVLAGRFYRYSSGFVRHPKCNCRHIPATEDTANDLTTDPMLYFDSLSAAQQDKAFTAAGAQAIRDGADISQVVNARRGAHGLDIAGGQMQRQAVYGRDLFTTTEGVTKRGHAGRTIRARGRNARTTPRLMPESIYEIADSRDEALRLLRMNGYVMDRSSRPRPSAELHTARAAADRASVDAGAGGGPPTTPGQNVPVPNDDDGEQLAALLTADFARWSNGLGPDQRDAIRQWQRADERFYQKIQALYRGGDEDPAALEVAELVESAIDDGALARDVVMWRGIRNSSSLFGVRNDNLTEAVGREVTASGLLAVSTSRAVAVEEFTKPSFGGGAALLRVRIAARTPAAWISPVGDPAMAYQRELLLGDRHTLRVLSVDYAGDTPIVDVEVI